MTASMALREESVATVRPDPSARLTQVFAQIHATRMAGLPFLNPALQVEAVGFRRWQGRWLGVLITPWFMNLLLLPDEAAAWAQVRYGDSLAYTLPAGVFEFISAREEALGDYQSCSLFSPVFEFPTQDAARATALAALEALFDAAARAGAEGPGTAAHLDLASASSAAAPAAVVEVPDAPARSRRNFLRGAWSGSPTAPGR